MKNVIAELSGRVLEILIELDELVEEGRELLVLESMKMEVPVVAPLHGTIEALHVSVGDGVEPGMTLLTMRPTPKDTVS